METLTGVCMCVCVCPIHRGHSIFILKKQHLFQLQKLVRSEQLFKLCLVCSWSSINAYWLRNLSQAPQLKAASTIATDVPDNTFEDSWNIFNPEETFSIPCYRPAHPKPVALGQLQHLSCELKIDDGNRRRCLDSMLSRGFALICSSLLGSPKEMKFAVSCSLACGLWLIFSVQNVPQMACSTLIS